MEIGVLGLDLIVLVLAIENVGIGRARDLDQRRGSMLLLRIPDGDGADNDDVRAHDRLGTENPDLGVVGVPREHHVLVQKLADAIVSGKRNEQRLANGNLPHLASELNLDWNRHVIEDFVVHDDDFQGIPMTELDGEVIPVLLAEKPGHRGVKVMGRCRHFS